MLIIRREIIENKMIILTIMLIIIIIKILTMMITKNVDIDVEVVEGAIKSDY